MDPFRSVVGCHKHLILNDTEVDTGLHFVSKRNQACSDRCLPFLFLKEKFLKVLRGVHFVQVQHWEGGVRSCLPSFSLVLHCVDPAQAWATCRERAAQPQVGSHWAWLCVNYLCSLEMLQNWRWKQVGDPVCGQQGECWAAALLSTLGSWPCRCLALMATEIQLPFGPLCVAASVLESQGNQLWPFRSVLWFQPQLAPHSLRPVQSQVSPAVLAFPQSLSRNYRNSH